MSSSTVPFPAMPKVSTRTFSTAGEQMAFERRFQTIDVEEPSVEDTVKILTALKPRYEEHHHVRYTQGAIEAAANQTRR